MTIQAQSETQDNPFEPARDAFESLLTELSSNETLSQTHSQVERLLAERGQELMRRAFQGHLDLRGPGRVMERVENAEGIALPFERLSGRNLETQFGRVRVERCGYYAHAEPTNFPLDGDLNLPSELYSHGVRRRLAQEVVRGSFDEAVTSLRETTGARLPKRQAEALAGYAAQDFDAFYDQRAAAHVSSFTEPLLIMSVDGKGVPMRREHLREATRKVADERKHKLTTKLSKGEKKGSKRMSTVAVVYTTEPYKRTPEQIVANLRGTLREADHARPRPTNKRAWASLTKPPDDVIGDAFSEALKRDPGKQKDWIALVDGNQTQLDCLERRELEVDVNLTIILDLMHVLVYLWKASHVFNPEGSVESEDWVYERLLQILRGRAGYVAGGIRRSATKRGLSKKDRGASDACASYLMKYRRYMRYGHYLEQGWPICTGAVEGACRHIVQDRLGKTGARWSLEGAEAVLRLRSLHASGNFDAYWEFHEMCERQRNHARRYADGIPAIASPASTVRQQTKVRIVKLDRR